MAKPKIWVDFNNADPLGRIRLNCRGTIEELAQQQIELREGLALILYSDDLDDKDQPDDLLADGFVSYSEEERGWVARIDWDAVRHASDSQTLSANGISSSRASRDPDQIN
jgi:hypothetical protein